MQIRITLIKEVNTCWFTVLPSQRIDRSTDRKSLETVSTTPGALPAPFCAICDMYESSEYNQQSDYV